MAKFEKIKEDIEWFFTNPYYPEHKNCFLWNEIDDADELKKLTEWLKQTTSDGWGGWFRHGKTYEDEDEGIVFEFALSDKWVKKVVVDDINLVAEYYDVVKSE